MAEETYRISTPFAVGAIVVSNGVIVETAPIFRRFFGRLFSNVEEWVRWHGYTIERLPSDPKQEPE